MSTTSTDFLSFAQDQLTNDLEISQRNAASRAYYAAFHAAKAVSNNLPQYQDVNGGCHTHLIDTLENHMVKSISRDRDMAIKSLGYILRQCRTLRTKADYHISLEFTKKEAELAIAQAKKIIEKAIPLTKEKVA
ncbi:HEPN domain-containing protein [Sedimenticola selenatireducens]|uniref:HEPN domain-containing protein n=1 Tax=Sedimenticola selenatireducens TaxID=191960 RepID=A0A558E1Y6_9GAMM|nr:HEPN domain-containing protein [Sedimenticola selenatireducens]TVO79049.1 HEPN domain-containing protein [Sedimenticola selenatireducens]TVT67159.1 MAG: HEPN domain-containing protein [Sedimenticola selenatireducens]